MVVFWGCTTEGHNLVLTIFFWGFLKVIKKKDLFIQVFLQAHMPIAFFMHSQKKKIIQMTTAVSKPSAGFSSVI